MGQVFWDNTFSIGIEEIDSQHRMWVQILNDLHDVLCQSSSRNIIEETKKAVLAMRDYTSFHFKTEEAYMKKINYPDLSSHRTQHNEFTLKVQELYNDVTEGKHVLSSEVMKILSTWLQDHILQVDKKIGLYTTGKQSG